MHLVRAMLETPVMDEAFRAQQETPGFAFVVRSMQLDFLRSARMDDVASRRLFTSCRGSSSEGTYAIMDGVGVPVR